MNESMVVAREGRQRGKSGSEGRAAAREGQQRGKGSGERVSTHGGEDVREIGFNNDVRVARANILRTQRE